MAFQCSVIREDFLEAIGNQQNITGKKGTMAILDNVLFVIDENHLTLTGTDLQIILKQTIEAEVTEPGMLTLPAKKLYEIARESRSPTITFEEEEKNWVRITAGSSFYRLAGMSCDEFPELPKFHQEAMVELSGEMMFDLIDKTSYAIALSEENQYTLTAALLEESEENGQPILQMVSSDSHRLAIMGRELEQSITSLKKKDGLTLIPRRGIRELRRFCESRETFSMGIEKEQMVIQDTNALLIIRLMEGVFPNFQSILNVLERDNVIRINRKRFLEGLKRINLFTEDLFHAIKIECQENNLVLTSQNADFGFARDEFSVEYTGPPLILGFNCRYFIEALSVLEGEVIDASIAHNKSPCLITSEEDKGYLGIIMPMTI